MNIIGLFRSMLGLSIPNPPSPGTTWRQRDPMFSDEAELVEIEKANGRWVRYRLKSKTCIPQPSLLKPTCDFVLQYEPHD